MRRDNLPSWLESVSGNHQSLQGLSISRSKEDDILADLDLRKFSATDLKIKVRSPNSRARAASMPS